MTAHIVGSGIASLAAAVYLIQDAKVPPSDIIIYEAGEDVGGAMMLRKVAVPPGSPERPKEAYVLAATRVLEREYRCALDLLSRFPSVSEGQETIEEDVVEFNQNYPYRDKARLLDKYFKVFSQEHMGIGVSSSVLAGFLLVEPEEMLNGKTVKDLFWLDPDFFKSQFFLSWSTLMGPLPAHSAIEFRRYFLRFLHVVPCVDTMETVWRMRLNQDESVARPIAQWLLGMGVHFLGKTVVKDVTLKQHEDGIWAEGIKTATGSTTLGKEDLVFVTLGSQIANLSMGSMNQPPKPVASPRDAWALWTQIKENGKKLNPPHNFGNPEKFFKPPNDPLSTWVTFTVTATDPLFLKRLTMLSGSGPRRQGLVTVVDSPWMITVAPFPKPHFLEQPDNIWTWWGFSLCHDKEGKFDRPGDHVAKPVTQCSGSEILTETIHQFGFGSDEKQILATSVCIPCLLPHAGSVWLVRDRTDRPEVVPEGAKNFAFIGQFCEMPEDTMFTMEYSVRSAREAVWRLFPKFALRPPPVYQGPRDDPEAVAAVVKRFAL